MKTRKAIYLLICSLLITIVFSACNKDNEPVPQPDSDNQVRITVGSEFFTATLYNNKTAEAFKELLPLTINMSELNGNEKYCDFSDPFPVNSSNPGRIQNGDMMIYGSQTLVLFYKSFNTSYRYTRLGRIENTSGLQNALGSGSVTVTFELP